MRTQRSLILASLAAALTVVMSGALAVPAEAESYYGDSARSVARRIDCKRFQRTFDSDSILHIDSGDCWLKGRKVSVVTFRNRQQDLDWNETVKRFFGPRFWWADGRGAAVSADNGNKPAARIGARRLPGGLRHG